MGNMAVLTLVKTEKFLICTFSDQNHAVFWQKKRHRSAKLTIF